VALYLEELAQLDALAANAAEQLRWGPLTVVFLLASAWWVKAPLFVAVAAACDLRRRRLIPVAAIASLVGVGLAAGVSTVLKQTFDRARPPDAGIGVEGLVATPLDPSFPSGHTLTAFAAAAAVSYFHPRLRVPLFALAALVGLSRIYLGVHFSLDVLAGAALGTVIGLATAALAVRYLTRSSPAAASAAPAAASRD
jgi:undecaprenyl-diphosphatase